MRYKAYFTPLQPSKLKAHPPSVEGQPQKNAPSRRNMGERFLSTRSLPLKARRRPQSRSALSTTGSHVTRATTSTSTDDANTGMLRSEATVLTAADATTVMRTG